MPNDLRSRRDKKEKEKKRKNKKRPKPLRKKAPEDMNLSPSSYSEAEDAEVLSFPPAAESE
jgi:hypothetical protein